MNPSLDGGLPTEIARVLPSDPQELLQIAAHVSSIALTQQIAACDSESESLREALAERDATIAELEQRVEALEADNATLEGSLRASDAEVSQLLGEKAALIESVKELNADIQKLETFQRTLLQSLQEHQKPREVSLGKDNGDILISSILSKAQPVASERKLPATTSYLTDSRQHMHSTAHSVAQPLSTPRNGNNTRLAAAQRPITRPSAPAHAASASNPASTLDGKDFFKQARSRLSYEQFAAFLQNIKELNAGKQTREDTLARARETFGDANQDLYTSFQNLLSRHLSVS